MPDPDSNTERNSDTFSDTFAWNSDTNPVSHCHSSTVGYTFSKPRNTNADANANGVS